MADQHPRATPRHLTPTTTPDPVQQAVDDYILMERKARAWDELRKFAGQSTGMPALLAIMDHLMQSL